MIDDPVGRHGNKGRAGSFVRIKMAESEGDVSGCAKRVQINKTHITWLTHQAIYGKRTVLGVTPDQHIGLVAAGKFPVLDRDPAQESAAGIGPRVDQIGIDREGTFLDYAAHHREASVLVPAAALVKISE